MSESFKDVLIERAYRIAQPPFKTPSKNKSSVVEKNAQLLGHVLCILGAMIICYGVIWNQRIYLVVGAGFLWLYDDMLLKAWRLKGSPKPFSCLLNSLKPTYLGTRSIRTFLVRYWLNTGLAQFEVKLLDSERIKILESTTYKAVSNFGGGSIVAFNNGEMHIVLLPKGVDVHSYSPDPRESYQKTNFSSIENFINHYLTEAIIARHSRETVMLPEVLKAHAEMHEPNIDLDTKVSRMERFTNLSMSIRDLHRKYYVAKVQELLNSQSSQLFKLILKS